MAENVSFLNIESVLEALGNTQTGVESTIDPQLGFRMWGGKDSIGAVTRWLAKNKPGSLFSLTLTDLTGGGTQIAKIDTNGLFSKGDLVANDLPDHNDLNGLQGGSVGEKYHVTLTEKNSLHAPMTLASNNLPLTLSGQELGFLFGGSLVVNANVLDVNAGGIDHNLLANTSVGDVHTQYVPISGSRGFVGTVTGQVPVLGDDLATKSYVDSSAQLLKAVDDNTLITSPATPATGERHLIAGIGGDWSTFSINDIVEYNGIAWFLDFDATVADQEGKKVFVISASNDFRWSGSSWDEVQVVTSHGALTGLTADDHTQYSLSNGTRKFSGEVGYTSNIANTVNSFTTAQQETEKVLGAGIKYQIANATNSGAVQFLDQFDIVTSNPALVEKIIINNTDKNGRLLLNKWQTLVNGSYLYFSVQEPNLFSISNSVYTVGEVVVGASETTILITGTSISGGSTLELNRFVKLTIIDNINANTITHNEVTGLLSGGELSVNIINNANYDIAEGIGQFIDYTEPTNPIRTIVVWNAIISNAVTATVFTTVTVDNLGVPFPIADRKETNLERRIYIGLGVFTHAGGGPNTTLDSPEIAFNILSSFRDYINLIGLVKSGLEISKGTGAFNVNMSSGITAFPYVNYRNDHIDNTTIPLTAKNDFTFTYAYQSAVPGIFTLISGQTSLDFSQYDDGTGTLAPVVGNDATVQIVAYFPLNDSFMVFFGQEVYTDFDSINWADTPILPSFITPDTTLILCQVGTAANAADLAAATSEIRNTGKFSELSSGASGSSAATDLNSLTDVTLTGPVQDEALMFNGSQWVNTTPLLANLGDVDISVEPNQGDILIYNTTSNKFEPAAQIAAPTLEDVGLNSTSALNNTYAMLQDVIFTSDTDDITLNKATGRINSSGFGPNTATGFLFDSNDDTALDWTVGIMTCHKAFVGIGNIEGEGQIFSGAFVNVGTAFNFNNGNSHIKTVTLSETYTFTNAESGGGYELILTDSAASTITWPVTVLWLDGIEPPFTGSGNKILCQFKYDGTNFLGSFGIYM